MSMGIPRQPFCSLPWCGRTGKIDMHHVVPRSQGGHDGPQVPICHECHMRHHSTERIEFVYETTGGWYARSGNRSGWLRVYDESVDIVPFDEPMPDHSALLDALAVARYSDWLLSRAVYDLWCAYGSPVMDADYYEFRDSIAESCDFASKSVGSWIRNRVAYGEIEGEGVELIGITRGVQVAGLVKRGHPLASVMADLRTMPRAQFDASYSPGGTST